MLEAVASAQPFDPRAVVVFSGDPIVKGLAPSFINGSSWSLVSMLQHSTRAEHIQGGRGLVVYDRGELGLYRSDSLLWLHREDVPRLRIFVWESSGRFVPKTLLALPVPGERFELISLRSPGLPAQTLTLSEIKSLPDSGNVYFARRASSHIDPSHF